MGQQSRRRQIAAQPTSADQAALAALTQMGQRQQQQVVQVVQQVAPFNDVQLAAFIAALSGEKDPAKAVTYAHAVLFESFVRQEDIGRRLKEWMDAKVAREKAEEGKAQDEAEAPPPVQLIT